MTTLAFTKMHGLGNDCVIVDGRAANVRLTAEQVRRLGDRHRGIGFDQLVLIEPDAEADARLRFLNADGSPSGACGNASRCVAELLGRREASLRTDAGLLHATRLGDGRVRVVMTPPGLDWRDVPLAEPHDTLALPRLHEALPPPVALSMGNPHAVFFVEDLEGLDVAGLGAALERHPIFPERANIGFARELGPERLRLRVFERGAGLTLACGSGACAALVAAVRRGLVRERAEVILDGGSLEIAWPGEGPVTMTGPTALSFQGTVEI